MNRLNQWFLENQRTFPWREEVGPYGVWISEVMLQQTRASVVVPYFEKWMKLFPDIVSLANAPLEQVIKAWEGLGYYSRARNLHTGAQQLLKEHGGNIPSDREALLKIKGLGPYTVAAILAFGFKRRAAPVDGNVLRVMSRFLWIESEIEKSSTRKVIEEKTEELLDHSTPWVTAEALIELGATVCLPKPRCDDCPLKLECKAALRSMPEALPLRREREKTLRIDRMVSVIKAKGSYLVKKNEAGKIMADLYEFPFFDGRLSIRNLQKLVENFVSSKIRYLAKHRVIKHTFTRFDARLTPVIFEMDELIFVEGWEWVQLERLHELPFSSGHRKIVKEYCNF